MTQDNLSRILLRTAVAILLIAAAIRICTYSCTSSNGYTSIEYQADTIRIRDTIRIPHPVSVTSRTIDTMTVLVHATDTLWIHDTLYMSLPIEQRTYADSTYTAWISGYRPKLDSILIYPQTTTITNTMTITHSSRQPRFSIGLQAGYGATISNNQQQSAEASAIRRNWDKLEFDTILR